MNTENNFNFFFKLHPLLTCFELSLYFNYRFFLCNISVSCLGDALIQREFNRKVIFNSCTDYIDVTLYFEGNVHYFDACNLFFGDLNARTQNVLRVQII